MAQLLEHSVDAYNGVLIVPEALPCCPEEFEKMLSLSLKTWKNLDRKGVWMKIPTSKSFLIPIAVGKRFEFHSAGAGWLMLTSWLSEDKDKLPPGASHQVGIGAFVLHKSNKNKVLVVQEKYGPLAGLGVWKLPTGLVEIGEDISAAAEREVLEETGVRAVFDSVLAMRQAHGVIGYGDKSDIFFVVALRHEEDTSMICIQEDEIDAAMWMDLDAFATTPFMKSRPMLQHIMHVCLRYARTGQGGLQRTYVSDGTRENLLLWNESSQGEDLWIGLSK